MKGTKLPEESALMVPGPPGSPPSPRRPGGETILTLVNGILAGVGGVFVGTHSVLVTVIAAVARLCSRRWCSSSSGEVPPAPWAGGTGKRLWLACSLLGRLADYRDRQRE